MAALLGSVRPAKMIGRPVSITPREAVIVHRLVFTDATGRELTTDDLAGFDGQVRWEVIGADAVPPEAAHLHRQARQAGEIGDYDRALRLLEQAHRLAPDWPYPLYDTAFTHLLGDDAVQAERYYAWVDRLAPRGFFTAGFRRSRPRGTSWRTSSTTRAPACGRSSAVSRRPRTTTPEACC